jgi:hypothetical protein
MENVNDVGQIPDRSYGEEMSSGERAEFVSWYEDQKSAVINNMRVLESY